MKKLENMVMGCIEQCLFISKRNNHNTQVMDDFFLLYEQHVKQFGSYKFSHDYSQKMYERYVWIMDKIGEKEKKGEYKIK